MGKLFLEWVWKLYNIAFESAVVPDNWRTTMIIPFINVNGRALNIIAIGVLSFYVWLKKIHTRILLDRVSRMTE